MASRSPADRQVIRQAQFLADYGTIRAARLGNHTRPVDDTLRPEAH
ncbi:MAG: hypothetical protein ACI915_001019 [Gammaproteobacteria bacterium]|jgi:hypothetical protein